MSKKAIASELANRNKYQEPDQSAFKPPDETLGPVALAKYLESTRLSHIIGNRIPLREPKQKGVFRYPPVLVQIERNPKLIARYIDLSPIDHSV